MKKHIAILCGAFVVLSTLAPCRADDATPDAVLKSAVACWNFEQKSSAVLKLSGGVELGVPLSESEQVESKLRGGDGLVARFAKGGWIEFNDEANEALKIEGDGLTFGLRFRCAPEVWNNSPIMSKHGGHEVLAFNLYCLNDAIGAEVGTTKNKGLLTCVAPRSETLDSEAATSAWHDVYCRVDSAKMELFVDGRCCDEDFTLGTIRTNDVRFLLGAQYDSSAKDAKPRAEFEGDVDFVAVWDRALSDEEIVVLSGGAGRVDTRSRVDDGSGASLQYWKPVNRYSVGDCMPFYAEGVFHFMYLLDKNHHGAKNGFGAHQWIQATSTDLKHWTHQPFVVPIDDQNEGSICTGSVFFYDGKYYAFYANRAVEYTLPNGETKNVYGLLCLSTSDDGINFEKQEPKPLFLMPEGYGQGTRDPVVFQDPRDGKFHMYITTNYRGKGCWAHAVSDDLKDWTLLDPVYTHKNGEPECPDWFKWGDDYYLIANHLNGYYRRSKSPLGPWEIPTEPNILMNGIINVPKTAPFGKDRRIICGWTREKGFGGCAVFHELIRREDGSLGEKFVSEMIPETLDAVLVEKNVPEEFEAPLPERFRLRLLATFDPQNIDLMRDLTLQYAGGRTLRVVFSERAVRLNDFVVERVDMSTGRIELDVVATSNIVDVCVNGERTVTDANAAPENRALKLTNESAKFLTIESLEVAPLKRF